MDYKAFPEAVGARARAEGDAVSEIRLYANKPARIKLVTGREIRVDGVSFPDFEATLAALMGHSLYAVEDELARGFFTLSDGSRVGVCGKLVSERGEIRQMGDISSICVRFARAAVGCAEALRESILARRGILVVSPPGMGKTTLLRDMARIASDAGLTVCVIDERGEIAAAALDVGARTDVYSYGERAKAMGMAVRAMAPEIIVTDEIGAVGDAEALIDSARSGATVFASAHGDSLEISRMRRVVARAVRAGVFARGALLMGRPGNIAELRDLEISTCISN